MLAINHLLNSDTFAMTGYLRPAETADALSALAQAPYTILAGGTDFYPARVGKPLSESMLDISGLNELRGIRLSTASCRIGALTTWSELLQADLPPCCDGLQQAARTIGGVQVQNIGTLGGNLCNASPAADSVPNLLALDAQVELLSIHGTRHLPLAEFILGNRRTARRAEELLSAIVIPLPAESSRSIFLKLGARRYLVISIVMLAVVLQTDDAGCVQDARIAVGACSEVAQRLSKLEQALLGRSYSPALLNGLEIHLREVLKPIDDVRASAVYRLDATAILLRRAIGQLLEQTV